MHQEKQSDAVDRDTKVPKRPARGWEWAAKQSPPENATDADDVGHGRRARAKSVNTIEHFVAAEIKKGDDDCDTERR